MEIKLIQWKDKRCHCVPTMDGPCCKRCRSPHMGDWREEQTGHREFACPHVATVKQSLTVQKMRGLGDVVAKVASAVGIKAKNGCGCKKRQEALNKLVPFRA